MPDTALMDEVMALITSVPTLHDQEVVARSESDLADEAAIELAAAPPEMTERVPDCGTAYCFGGWALVLRGYRFLDVRINELHRGWYSPSGERIVGPLLHAAELLGIRYEEAYDTTLNQGLFHEHSRMEDLEAWIAYYKGEIDRDDLEFRLGCREDA